jgi:hypothetical protein
MNDTRHSEWTRLWDRLQSVARTGQAFAADPKARANIDAQMEAIKTRLCELSAQRQASHMPEQASRQ